MTAPPSLCCTCCDDALERARTGRTTEEACWCYMYDPEERCECAFCARVQETQMQPNPILKANMDAWESYAASPHFTDGDRRQDFDNGWDEALEWVAALLWEWTSGPARGEAADLAERTDELLELLNYRGT